MTTPIFASPLNNISTTLAADYTAGSDEIAIAEGYGDTITAELARLGLPSISSDAPLRFTVTRVGGVNLTTGQILDATDQTVFEATSLDSDTLSGLTVVEGTTDQDFATSDILRVEVTAGQITAIQDSIVDTQDFIDSPDIDYATPYGPSGTTTFPADGSIVETQTNGLVVTTTFPANGSIVEVYSGPISKTVTTVFNADGSITEVVI
jgi:hypothetical protein